MVLLILFTRKKDGILRMCIDNRAVNKQTWWDSYPTPRIDDLLDRLTYAMIFSKIDLSQGHHQVAIKAKDKHKIAFISRFGLFEWHVLPFGLCNAPSTFQRLMNSTLDALLDQCILVYLDDILVYSHDKSEHERHLHTMFQ